MSELVLLPRFFIALPVVEAGNEAVGAFVRMLSYAAEHFPETAILPLDLLGVAVERGASRKRALDRLRDAQLVRVGPSSIELLGRGDLWLIRGASTVDAATARAVFARDDNRCTYCGATGSLTVDHVMPSSRGGGSDVANLVAACVPCNSSKGNRTPEEWAAGVRLPRGRR